MFICRYHLLRSYETKYSTFALSCRTYLLERHYSSYFQRHVCRRLLSSSRRGGQGGLGSGESFTGDTTGNAAVDVASTTDLLRSRRTVATFKPGSNRWRKQPVTAYFQLRNEDKTKIADVPVKNLKRFIQVAIHHKRADYIDYITKDVIRYFAGEERLELLTALLAVSGLHEVPLLRKDKLLMLIQALQESNYLSRVPQQVLIMAATSTISSAADPELDIPLILALSPLMLQYVSRPSHKGDGRYMLPHHPVANLLLFVERLITLGQRQASLKLLKQLMDHNIMSAHASSVDLYTADFDHIVTSILVNACLERHWFPQAVSILTEVLNRDTAQQTDIDRNVFRVLAHMLRSFQKGDLQTAASVIARILSTPAKLPDAQGMMDRVLTIFYHQAWKAGEGALMETIYELTRSPEVSTQYTCTPPSGHALLWLFNHLTQKSRNFGLARLLAQQIVDDDVDIPHFDRPSLIASIAASGFASSARILWERLATRKGAQIVLGNAGTMLRIVNLFVGLARRASVRSSSKKGAVADEFFYRKVPSQADLGEYTRIFTGTLVKYHLDPGHRQPGTDGGVKGADENSNAHFEMLDRLGRDIPTSPHRSPSDTFKPTLQSSEERAHTLRAFAYRVMLAYYNAKRPLRFASHFDMNALARAYFLIDEYAAGFDVLVTLAFYREGPDIQDVNVALSAIAAASPAQGALMLERMSEFGMKPDAVSFGTVIHHAVVQDDMPLVTTLLARAREQNIPQLSFMTIGSLMRRSAAGSSTDSAQEDLAVVNDLVDSLLDASSIPTPRMGMDCVTAALRADDPVTAFKFWKLFLKGKVDWHGDKQINARRCIAQRIRRHCLRASLKWSEGRVMLAELGDNVKSPPT